MSESFGDPGFLARKVLSWLNLIVGVPGQSNADGAIASCAHASQAAVRISLT